MKDTATQIDETSISRLLNKRTDYGYAMVSAGTSVMENVKEYFTRRGRGREFAFLSEAEQPHTIMGCHCLASQGEIFLNPYSNSDI